MEQPVRTLMIDDDQELCELVGEYLRPAGFEVVAVGDPDVGVRHALGGGFAVVVLDVMLPGTDGFDVLRRIRARSALPVLMLSARGEEIDRIVGLEVGADDYLPKPFNPRELVARLRAILRRGKSGTGSRLPSIIVGEIAIDPSSRSVVCAGTPVPLTSAEFGLLEVLARSAGKVVSREDIARSVLGRRLFPEDRSIDVHISNLRRKLRSCGAAAECIQTLRGAGYVMTLPPTADGARRTEDDG
ncbi:MAG: response regulator transcription factor [Phycisphaerales bacterium]|nr:response regulator transcription factor [Phycisphaerales bacterium]